MRINKREKFNRPEHSRRIKIARIAGAGLSSVVCQVPIQGGAADPEVLGDV